MKLGKNGPRLSRAQLHDKEEYIKSVMRDQIAEAASLLEIVLSLLVLLGMLISVIPTAREMLTLWSSDSTESFQIFLGHAFNLVIGIEFIKMLAKHSPGSALEVLLYAIARHMILGGGSAAENLLGVLAIGIIFFIRKFLFVPAFGSSLPPLARGNYSAQQSAAPADDPQGDPDLTLS